MCVCVCACVRACVQTCVKVKRKNKEGEAVIHNGNNPTNHQHFDLCSHMLCIFLQCGV